MGARNRADESLRRVKLMSVDDSEVKEKKMVKELSVNCVVKPEGEETEMKANKTRGPKGEEL